MSDFLSYDELSLAGLEIEPVDLRVERLTAKFGGGYGASAAVGHESGLWGWELGAEVLADDTSYQDQIGGLPSFEYYRQFFLDHTVGAAGEIFQIDFRGRKFHCSFADDAISGSMLTYDLFSLAGVRLEMRRVPGIYYLEDGSIFDPRDVAGLWGWWRGEDWDSGDLVDLSGNGHNLDGTGDVLEVAAVQNGRPVARLNSVANTGFVTNNQSVRIYAGLIVLKMREATFSNAAGVLTGLGGASTKILEGTSAGTKFVDQGFGGTFAYKKDGTTYAESNMLAPMNTFGIVSFTSSDGIELDGLQFGKSRTTAGTFAEADIGEILLYGTAPLASPQLPSATDMTNLIAFLRRGWATPAS